MSNALNDFLPDDVATLRQRLWPLLQTAIAATVSWQICLVLLPNHAPTFTVLAIVTGMNVHPGHRGKWMLQVALGAVLGVLLSNAVGMIPAPRTLLVLLVLVLTLAIGVLFYSHNWFLINAAAGGVIPIATGAVDHGFAFGVGWQALVALGVSLVFTQLLFPVDAADAVRSPLRGLLRGAGQLLGAAAAGLDGAATESRGPRTADADEALDGQVRTLHQKLSEGRGVTRLAPRRFGQRHVVDRYAAAVPALERLAGDVGGLVHLADRTDGAPSAVVRGCADLGAALDHLASDVDDPARQAALGRCAEEIATRLVPPDDGSPRTQALRVLLSDVARDARDAARALRAA